MKRIILNFIFIGILFLSNDLIAQTVCSAPYKGEDVCTYNNTVWFIGESDEKGHGVFKYENSQWYFYGMSNATKIEVTNANEPLVIDNNKNLYIYKGSWNVIGNNVTAMAGSRNSNNIWALVNNNLNFYKNNTWNATQYDPMLIKDIGEDQNGILYTINSSGYVFKLNGNAWEIVGNKKGNSLYPGSGSEIYLVSDEYTNSGNVIYKLNTSTWVSSGHTGKALAMNRNRAVFLIDGFGVIYLIEKGNKTKISIDKIAVGTTTTTTGTSGNFDYGNNVHAIDSTTGETPLFKAVANNDLPGIYTLLSKKADINKTNNNGQTPLIKAIILGHSDVALKLIELKANLDVVDKKNKNALAHACMKGNLDIVKSLIKNGANVSAVDVLSDALTLKPDQANKVEIITELVTNKARVTVKHLDKAVNDNETEIFKLLNAQENIPNISVNDYNRLQKTAIDKKNVEIVTECVIKGADSNQAMQFANTQNNKDLMMLCLDKGANPNIPVGFAIEKNDMELYKVCLNTYKASKDSALIASINAKKNDYAKVALEAGADPNKAMLATIKTNDIAFVQLLFDHNASATDSTYMIEAVTIKNKDIISLLISKGADANYGTLKAVELQDLELLSLLLESASASKPALIKSAAQKNSLEIVKLLLDKGADPNQGILDGVTYNKVNNAKELIARGANATSENLIVTATEKGFTEITKLLIENGANANAGLMPAIQNNRNDVFRYLLDQGADISDKEIIITAVNLNRFEMVSLLIDKGADVTVKDDKNNNLLHLSAKNYSEMICSKLINTNKIDINAFNDYTLSPLMIVVMNGRGESENLCRLFVQNGADVNARNADFEPVYKIAKGRRIKKYLKSQGAAKK